MKAGLGITCRGMAGTGGVAGVALAVVAALVAAALERRPR